MSAVNTDVSQEKNANDTAAVKANDAVAENASDTSEVEIVGDDATCCGSCS